MTKVAPKRPTKPKSLAWRLGWTMTLLISQVILFVLFVTHALVGAVELGTDGWIQNITGNILTLFDRLLEVGNDPWLHSSVRAPTLLFDDVQFSGK